MNLALHIVRKDVRRLWFPVVLWLGLIMGKHFVDWRRLHAVSGDDGAWGQRMIIASILLAGFHAFVGYVLAAAVVMEDPPTGTNPFWRTRPIAGRQLLAAKLLACGAIFIVLPVLVSLPWWFANDTKSLGIALPLGEFVLKQFSLTLAAIVVASFTGSFGRFLGWSLVLPVTLIAVALPRHDGYFDAAKPVSMDTGMKLLVAVAVLGFAAAVLLQYQTARKHLALGILVASAIFALTALYQV
jgi:hypothetical protein